MDKQTLIKRLQELPDDYDVCISSYHAIDGDDDENVIIFDNPIIGLAVNHDTKEIRFVTENSDFDSIIDGINEL